MGENQKNSGTSNAAAHKVGQIIGYAFASILVGCVSAVVVALTGKFILWLF